MREAEFMAQVIELARLRQWIVYHTHDSRHSGKGFPDLFLLRERDGRRLCMELKVGASVTPEQAKWLKLLNACGIDAAVYTPLDWDKINRLLE